MMNAGELRLESASFSHDGGRDYNEDAVGDSDAFGAVRLFMLADGAGGQGGGDVAAQTASAAAPLNAASAADCQPPWRAVRMAASPSARPTSRMAAPRRMGGIDEADVASTFILPGSSGG